jgi:hypothetical protein
MLYKVLNHDIGHEGSLLVFPSACMYRPHQPQLLNIDGSTFYFLDARRHMGFAPST